MVPGCHASVMLRPEGWVVFKDQAYADYVIGGPTIEMWSSSWNSSLDLHGIGNFKKVYPDFNSSWNSESYGYNISQSEILDSKGFSLNTKGSSSDDDFYNTNGSWVKLYWPPKGSRTESVDGTENSYYLASTRSVLCSRKS